MQTRKFYYIVNALLFTDIFWTPRTRGVVICLDIIHMCIIN